MVRTAAGKACASIKTAIFSHRSFAIIRVSGKEQQELAMCWRCDRVNKTYDSAIVIDTRAEGSKDLGHRSFSFSSEYLYINHNIGRDSRIYEN